jgi:hypothetical protein
MSTTRHQDSHPGTRTHRLAAAIAFAGSGLLVLFWTLYFSGILAFGGGDPVTTAFEAAFPVADAVLAAILLTAGLGLSRHRRWGRYGLTVGSAMTLYLGILDLTFYSRQGLYAPLGGDGAVELAVNLLCITGGLVGLTLGWILGRYDHVRDAA